SSVTGVQTCALPISSFSVSSSNAGAFAALGFSGTVTAATPPLRVSGSPLGSATSLVNGSATTVNWYTGNSGPGTARSSSTIRIDTAQSIQFGAQANELAVLVALMRADRRQRGIEGAERA